MLYYTEKYGGEKMFERIDYKVLRIDGDYAYLEKIEEPGI